jgi:hypothetical protein
MVSQNFLKCKNIDLILNITKISVICFVSITLILNVIPFYLGDGSYIYANSSVNLSNGIFSITNELLEETGRTEFVGNNWVKTDENLAIPQAGPRISIIGALFYSVAGYYGLLFLTPFFLILLLITSERFATNLFGKYVGLLTLLFIATSNLVFRNSIALQSDIVFSFFILLGAFFLFKYLKEQRDLNLFFASSIFAFSSILRINGLVFFPIEVFVFVGYFIMRNIYKNSEIYSSKSVSYISKISFRKKTFKNIIFLLLPWMIFFSAYGLYHDHYFGDPFTNYNKISERTVYANDPTALLNFDNENFENIKAYSKYLLPYQFPAVYNKIDNNFDDILGENWLGIISLSLLFSILVTSVYFKKKRTELLILILLILANLWFYSSITSSERATQGVAGRYMIPVFTFSIMVISYMIVKFFHMPIFKKSFSKLLKYVIIFGFAVFFLFSFYTNPYTQKIFDDNYDFNKFSKLFEQYPLDSEGLTNKSVILSVHGDRVLDYQSIPFWVMDKGKISLDSLDLLKQIVNDGYDVYVFKHVFNQNEKNVITDLRDNYGVALKEYSPTFCKVILVSGNGTLNSDKICYILDTVK